LARLLARILARGSTRGKALSYSGVAVMEKRYLINWLPAVSVEDIYRKHKEAIDNEGYSVWDFTSPEYLEENQVCNSEESALWKCSQLVRHDEYGELHVYEQVKDEHGQWESVRKAVFYEDTEFFDWESYETLGE
jgi:hypothetical protein